MESLRLGMRQLENGDGMEYGMCGNRNETMVRVERGGYGDKELTMEG